MSGGGVATGAGLSAGGADAVTPDDGDRPEVAGIGRARRAVLLGSVLLVASCGLAYEIVAGAVGTYVLGDGVLQFALTIGIFLSSMGVGSFLSRFVRGRLLATFFGLELIVGVLGAAVAPALLWTYASDGPYVLALILVLGGIGVCSGMDIPLLLRAFKHHDTLRRSASSVLGLDYLGALAGALAVPILLLPWVGTIGAGCLFGLLNLVVALVGALSFPEVFRRRGRFIAAICVLAVPMVGGVVFNDAIGAALEDDLYQDPVVYAETTPFQRIVVTRWRGDVRLFLNGSLQMSSRDEYRYHEALVHPAMAAAAARGGVARVLVLGGGDGLVVREALKWPGVVAVELVDLDPGVTRLAQTHPDLVALNAGSLNDQRVTVHHADAVKFVEAARDRRWDVILMDLPDPSTATLARLYAHSTLRLVLSRLTPRGVLATQATSPFFAPAAFWCIVDTLDGQTVGGPGGPRAVVQPYHVTVPSFGLWGFALVTADGVRPEALRVPVAARYLSEAVLPGLFVFPPDLARPAGDRCINRMDDPVLAREYRAGWSRFGE